MNGQFDCVLVSVHLKATGLSNEDIERTKTEASSMNHVLKALESHVPGK